TADGPAGVLADPDGSKVGSNAGAGSAGGAGWTTSRIIRISHDAEPGTKISGSKFAHRCLGDDDRSGFLQLHRDCGVPPRNEVFEDLGSVRRRHIARFDLILKKNGNAMQGTHTPGRSIRRIQPLSFLERAGVHRLNGIQVWPFLVVCFYALYIKVDQFAARDPLRLECSMDVLDRRFQKMKICRSRA